MDAQRGAVSCRVAGEEYRASSLWLRSNTRRESGPWKGEDIDKAREGEDGGEGRPGSLGQSELLTGSKSRHSGPSWKREKRNSNVTQASLPGGRDHTGPGAILNLKANQM